MKKHLIIWVNYILALPCNTLFYMSRQPLINRTLIEYEKSLPEVDVCMYLYLPIALV